MTEPAATQRGIPPRVAAALVAHMASQGMPPASATAFVGALSTDLAAGVTGSRDIYDKLALAATPATVAGIHSLAAEIADLARDMPPVAALRG